MDHTNLRRSKVNTVVYIFVALVEKSEVKQSSYHVSLIYNILNVHTNYKA
jgi:hypothetical protein